MSGYSAEKYRAWKAATSDIAKNIRTTGTGVCLNDQSGERMGSAGFCIEPSAKARSVGYDKEKSPALRESVVPGALVVENHRQDKRYKISANNISPTLDAHMGTGGDNVPYLLQAYSKAAHAKTKEDGQTWVESETAHTLNAHDTSEAFANEIVVGIDRAAFNQGKNAQYEFQVDEELAQTIIAKGPGAVALPYGFYPQMKAECQSVIENKANTLVNGTNPGQQNGVIEPVGAEYIARRLTPLECCRLQGFPDDWCNELQIENPTDEDIAFWRWVFEEYGKPKTDKQIKKWLTEKHTDSAEYKMWGNGVALPCVYFVLSGIEWAYENNIKESVGEKLSTQTEQITMF